MTFYTELRKTKSDLVLKAEHQYLVHCTFINTIQLLRMDKFYVYIQMCMSVSFSYSKNHLRNLLKKVSFLKSSTQNDPEILLWLKLFHVKELEILRPLKNFLTGFHSLGDQNRFYLTIEKQKSSKIYFLPENHVSKIYFLKDKL